MDYTYGSSSDNSDLVLGKAMNSSEFADMRQSITHSRTNNLNIDSITEYYQIDDTIMLGVNQTLNKYRNIIEQLTIPYKLRREFYYRPEYISYDMYGTTELWYLIMFINNFTNPSDINKEDILVLDPNYISYFKNILFYNEVEGTYKEPVKIESSVLKGLNESSAQLFKNNSSDSIPAIRVDRINTDKIIQDLSTAYDILSTRFYQGKLEKSLFTLVDEKNNTFKYKNTELISGVFLDHDVQNGGLPASWNNQFRMEYKGYFLADETGTYNFRPIFTGKGKMYFNNEAVYSQSSEAFQVSPCYFEKQTKNNSFQKNNTDGWIVNDSVYTNDNGTNCLKASFFKETTNKNVATVNLDVSEILTFEELAFTTKYKSIADENLLFAGSVITVEYDNGLVETFKNNENYGLFNNNGNYVENTVIVSFQRKLKLKSLKVTFPVTKGGNDESTFSGEVLIASLKVQRMFLWSTYSVDLEKGKWYPFSFQYDIVNLPAPYLQLYFKKPSENTHRIIPSEYFGTNVSETQLEQNQKFLLERTINIAENKEFLTTVLSNKLGKIDSKYLQTLPDVDKIFSDKFFMNVEFNKYYKIKGNVNSQITVKRNNDIWFIKYFNEEEASTLVLDGDTDKDSFIEIIYEQKNDSNFNYELLSLPDYKGNDHFGTAIKDTNYVLDNSINAMWVFNSNNIKINNEHKGLEKFFFRTTKEMSDYSFSLAFSVNDLSHTGGVGIILRAKSDTEYYLLNFKIKGKYENNYLDSGLYKFSNVDSKLDLTKDGKYTSKGKLLQSFDLDIANNFNFNLIISLSDNTIIVYEQSNYSALVNYKDYEANYFKYGTVGFQLFNVKDLEFYNTKLTLA